MSFYPLPKCKSCEWFCLEDFWSQIVGVSGGKAQDLKLLRDLLSKSLQVFYRLNKTPQHSWYVNNVFLPMKNGSKWESFHSMNIHKWGVNLNVFRFIMVFGGAEVKLNKPQPLTADLDGNAKQSLSNREHFPIRNIQPVPLKYYYSLPFTKESESRTI